MFRRLKVKAESLRQVKRTRHYVAISHVVVRGEESNVHLRVLASHLS